jgi:hypothetical protein
MSSLAISAWLTAWLANSAGGCREMAGAAGGGGGAAAGGESGSGGNGVM